MKTKAVLALITVLIPALCSAARQETAHYCPTDMRDAIREPSIGAMDALKSAAGDPDFGRSVINSLAAPVPAKAEDDETTGSAWVPDYAVDNNVPAEVQTQLRNDLAFIRSIKGTSASDLHKKVFGNVDGSDYIRFFETRVKGIGMDVCGSTVMVACVHVYSDDASKMWLTENYSKFSHPQIARMMIVFHEARHTESYNGNWLHSECPDPFRDENGNDIRSIWTGELLTGPPAACDMGTLGSYGISVIMLKNIQKFCSNCTDKVRMDAGIYADDQFKRLIEPVSVEEIKNDLYR
jgi:hypothetical protein